MENMRIHKIEYNHFISIAIAVALGLAGLLFASVSIFYIAGMFGISSSLAGQIVEAVSIGSTALAIALAVATGGVAAIAVASAKAAIKQWGKSVAVA